MRDQISVGAKATRMREQNRKREEERNKERKKVRERQKYSRENLKETREKKK